MLVDVAIEGRRRVDATDGRRFETPESLTDAVGGGFTDLVDACETLCFLPRPNILCRFSCFSIFPPNNNSVFSSVRRWVSKFVPIAMMLRYTKQEPKKTQK